MRTMEVLGFLLLALNFWALYDILRRPVDLGSKLLWLLIVWLFPYVGVLLYLILGRPSLARSEQTRGPGH